MDEKFFAWLDGELTPMEAAEMEARVAADPALAQAAEQHRALGAKLRAAFDPIAEAPAPQRVVEAVKPRTHVPNLAEWRERKQAAVRSLPQWAAMAATLAIGVVGGTMMRGQTGGPIELRGGQMIAASSLDQALETQLASADAGDTRIGLTFRDGAGRICRSFTTDASSGLACRDGDVWRVKGLFAAPEGQSGSYRMAAGADPNLAALIDSSIAGEPFNAAQETAAQRQGWR